MHNAYNNILTAKDSDIMITYISGSLTGGLEFLIEEFYKVYFFMRVHLICFPECLDQSTWNSCGPIKSLH